MPIDLSDAVQESSHDRCLAGPCTSGEYAQTSPVQQLKRGHLLTLGPVLDVRGESRGTFVAELFPEQTRPIRFPCYV